MKLPHPFIQLPLRFDAARLAAEAQAIEEAHWRPHPDKIPGNSMLPLIAANGDPTDESFVGAMRPTPLLERCSYFWQVLAALGVTIGRTRLMRLAGHAEVGRHADQGYYWVDRVRVHIPVVTQPTVRFECGDAAVNMGAGECWIFDTWRLHRVINDNDDERIHLVVDTVGGEAFWRLAAVGRVPGGSERPDWAPAVVAFEEHAPRPQLELENFNVPDVMSPWELESRIGFLFREVGQHPNLPTLQQHAALFVRDWRVLWAKHGARGDDVAPYKRKLEQFMGAIQGAAAQIHLPNRVNLYGAIVAMIAQVAVTARGEKRSAVAMSDHA
jgi:hypothetical protein